MGLPRAAVNLLLRECAMRPMSGTIATLGRQHVYVTLAEFQAMARNHGVQLADVPIELHREPELRARGYLSDDTLLAMLGFSRCVRIDRSDYEAPDEVLDLNDAETPQHLIGQFDVVLDSGTLEHVFDVPAVLRHCTRLVRPSGRVIHLTPSSNCLEHGFYTVSPTLYADYYAASGFDLNDVLLCRMPAPIERGAWRVYDYLASNGAFIPIGRLNRGVWFTLAVATAREDSAPAIPQQSFYLNRWKDSSNENSTESSDTPTSKADRLLARVAHSPRLTRLAEWLIRTWRSSINRIRDWRTSLPYPYVGRF